MDFDTEALDSHSAADAFSSLLGGEGPQENETEDDSPEAAAERLAKQELSGSDEDASEDASDEQPAADTITVEIDGKAVTLTKEQIAENHKNGLRQQDYTRKTMEAADVRKAADAELQQARHERANYAQQLNHFSIQADGEIQYLESLLTEQALQEDPVTYLTNERILKQRQALKAKADGELNQLQAQYQQETAQQQQKEAQEQWANLIEKLPDWKDPEKAKAESSAIKEYLAKEGYEPAERDFTNHKHIVTARKAMLYDALIERAGKAVKKVTNLPVKVERSGNPEASKPDARADAIKRLGKTGSINDAANAFSQILK